MWRYISSIWWGVSLQIIFLILFFGAVLPRMNNLFGAMTCLFIGFVSLVFGVYSFRFRKNSTIAVCVIVMAILILLFTIFAYFLGEAGYPPEIILGPKNMTDL